MSGLAKICKLYGGMKVTANGKTVEYRYDYGKDKPVKKKRYGKKEGKEQQESGRAESPATDSLE